MFDSISAFLSGLIGIALVVIAISLAIIFACVAIKKLKDILE